MEMLMLILVGHFFFLRKNFSFCVSHAVLVINDAEEIFN